MAEKKPRKKKEKPKGEYRNLQLMPDRTDLWQFEVLTRTKGWVTITNLGGESKALRETFAQKTADRWRKE